MFIVAALLAVGWALATSGVMISNVAWRSLPNALAAFEVGGLPFYIAIGALALPAARISGATAPWRLSLGTVSLPNFSLLCAASAVTGWLYLAPLTHVCSGAFVLRPTIGFISGALVAPVLEEWLFRGAVWSLVESAVGVPTRDAAALLVTTIGFALWHLPFADHGPLWAHGLFGLSLGILRLRFRSIAPGVVLHSVGNAIALLAAPGGI